MGLAGRFTTRKEIREKIAAVLCNKTDAGRNVFPNRVRPVGDSESPYILIYPRTEDVIRLRKESRTVSILRRDLEIVVQIIAENSDEKKLSDTLDKIAGQIEKAIQYSDGLGVAHDISLSSGSASFSGEGDRPEGSWAMIFNVTYVQKPEE